MRRARIIKTIAALSLVGSCGDADEAALVMHPCGQGFASQCASPDNYAKIAVDAKNIHRSWRLGDPEWSETLVDFSNRAFNEDYRLGCGELFGEQLTQSCAYKIILVVESKDGAGAILYSEATNLEGNREPACVAYSGCISAGYVGKSIRMPNGASHIEALAFFVQALRPEDLSYDLRDATFLRLTIEEMQEDYDRLSAKDWKSNKRHRFVVPHLKDEIDYMQRHLAKLE